MASQTTWARTLSTSTSTMTIPTKPTPTFRLQALQSDPSRPTPKPAAYEVNEQHTSPFFRLPGELRNEIYNHLLSPDTKHLSELAMHPKEVNTQHTTHPPNKPTPLYPAILSTCRKAYLEATPLLYESHVFHAHTSLLTSLPHLTSAYRPVLHPRSIGLIKRWQVSLRLDTDPQFTAEQARKAFSGAEYLEVRVWEAQFEMCDYAALALLMGVRGVKVARVGGSVGEEVARWMERLMMSEEGEGVGMETGLGSGELVLERGLESWRVGGHLIGVR